MFGKKSRTGGKEKKKKKKKKKRKKRKKEKGGGEATVDVGRNEGGGSQYEGVGKGGEVREGGGVVEELGDGELGRLGGEVEVGDRGRGREE